MEPFNLLALTADRRAARENDARIERLWRRGRRPVPAIGLLRNPIAALRSSATGERGLRSLRAEEACPADGRACGRSVLIRTR